MDSEKNKRMSRVEEQRKWIKSVIQRKWIEAYEKQTKMSIKKLKHNVIPIFYLHCNYCDNIYAVYGQKDYELVEDYGDLKPAPVVDGVCPVCFGKFMLEVMK